MEKDGAEASTNTLVIRNPISEGEEISVTKPLAMAEEKLSGVGLTARFARSVNSPLTTLTRKFTDALHKERFLSPLTLRN